MAHAPGNTAGAGASPLQGNCRSSGDRRRGRARSTSAREAMHALTTGCRPRKLQISSSAPASQGPSSSTRYGAAPGALRWRRGCSLQGEGSSYRTYSVRSWSSRAGSASKLPAPAGSVASASGVPLPPPCTRHRRPASSAKDAGPPADRTMSSTTNTVCEPAATGNAGARRELRTGWGGARAGGREGVAHTTEAGCPAAQPTERGCWLTFDTPQHATGSTW